MAIKKILTLAGDYAEDSEAMVPFQALLTVGHAVRAVCPGKRRRFTCRGSADYQSGAGRQR